MKKYIKKQKINVKLPNKATNNLVRYIDIIRLQESKKGYKINIDF